MNNSRIKNATRNISYGFINKMIALFFPFLMKTVIIRTMGSQYLGLNGLFTSILQVLNLAELGFSSAVVFSMYKPITENNKSEICALLNLYKKIYRVIGVVILLVGITLLPFLTNLISGSYPNEVNIYFLYIIYLLNTALTYFLFAYKTALLVAHQRSDVVSNIQSIVSIFQYIVQIMVLVIFKNYYLYLFIMVMSTIINNLMCSLRVDKMYPDYKCSGDITETAKKDIRKRVSGLMVQKVCATTRNSLDCVFISAFLGLDAVAIYSNYYSLIAALIGIMSIVTTAMLAGVGNSIVIENKEKNYKDMNKFNYIYMWLSGWLTICLVCLYQPFMKIWMGQEYMYPFSVVVLLCIYFYSLKMGDIRAAYSDAKGLWWENRYRAIAESIMNILLNFVLGKLLGIHGIILGTLISLLVINFGYGSQILFKYYFDEHTVREYFGKHFVYAIVTSCIAVVTYFVVMFIKLDNVVGLGIKAIICVVVPNIIYFLIYRKTKIFSESVILFEKIIRNIPVLNKIILKRDVR